jgi:hypothetical protein
VKHLTNTNSYCYDKFKKHPPTRVETLFPGMLFPLSRIRRTHLVNPIPSSAGSQQIRSSQDHQRNASLRLLHRRRFSQIQQIQLIQFQPGQGCGPVRKIITTMKKYRNLDPRYIKTKFNSTCKTCGINLPKGTNAIHFPASKAVFCQSCGHDDYQKFQESVADELFLQNLSRY